MKRSSPNIDGPRLRWLQGVPSGAFWLLEGVLVTLLAVCILFARREDVTVDAILAPYPKVAATAPPEAREERAIQAMHAVHELLWPRLTSFDASGVGTDFWFRSTYSHLMAPTGHCGSFAQVLARALQRDGYDVKIAQMRVGDVWGGHIYVVADVGDRWIALDPYFDVAFRGQDGRVLGPSELKDNWEQVRSQCPPGYNPSYRHEAVRYTNWRGVPMDIFGSLFGRISVRAMALNLYWLVVWVCASALAVSIPLHLLHRRLARLARPAER